MKNNCPYLKGHKFCTYDRFHNSCTKEKVVCEYQNIKDCPFLKNSKLNEGERGIMQLLDKSPSQPIKTPTKAISDEDSEQLNDLDEIY